LKKKVVGTILAILMILIVVTAVFMNSPPKKQLPASVSNTMPPEFDYVTFTIQNASGTYTKVIPDLITNFGNSLDNILVGNGTLPSGYTWTFGTNATNWIALGNITGSYTYTDVSMQAEVNGANYAFDRCNAATGKNSTGTVIAASYSMTSALNSSTGTANDNWWNTTYTVKFTASGAGITSWTINATALFTAPYDTVPDQQAMYAEASLGQYYTFNTATNDNGTISYCIIRQH
jgi:hypothetical protein